jgi:hypothetical protein
MFVIGWLRKTWSSVDREKLLDMQGARKKGEEF